MRGALLRLKILDKPPQEYRQLQGLFLMAANNVEQNLNKSLLFAAVVLQYIYCSKRASFRKDHTVYIQGVIYNEEDGQKVFI